MIITASEPTDEDASVSVRPSVRASLAERRACERSAHVIPMCAPAHNLTKRCSTTMRREIPLRPARDG